jgi:hypothetical protein
VSFSVAQAETTERVTVGAIRELLGGSPVLLAFPPCSKVPAAGSVLESCIIKSDSAPDMGNIGVLVGPDSGNVISVDLDSDEVAEAFISLNSDTCQQTLITRGRRGCNVWFRLKDQCPPFRNLKLGGEDVGELRSSDNGKKRWTIIQGTHPDQPHVEYTITNRRKALELTMEELGRLKWLDGRTLAACWSRSGCHIETQKLRNPDVEERERAEGEPQTGVIPPELIGKAISDFLPTASHQTNKLQHSLCRRIKKLMLDHNAPVPDLNEIGMRWYESAKPHLRTELSMQDYVDEFLERFSVTHTAEGDYLQQAFRNSAVRPIPPELAGWSKDHQRMAQLCMELAELQNDCGKFILSTVQIDSLFGYDGDRKKAQRKLRGLIGIKLIEKVQSGNYRYANTYRYVGGGLAR